MARVPTRYRLVRPPLAPVAAPDLDPSQRAVVEHPGGPLLVLAGPGTGKTTTLVEAVVDRVRRGCAPDEVLVLTFSRKAADELKERIAGRLGRTVTEPPAFTFHSWCYALVRAHSPGGVAPRLLSQPERDVRIRELLRGHVEGAGLVRWPRDLRPALLTRGFAREVAALFDRARERGLDGRGVAELGERHGRADWVAAGAFLDEYLDVLDARGEIDYAGLVAAATALLEHGELAASVSRRYRWVFVDEYQDTDPSQERLLRVLASGGADVVVVGDPDQSIYGFRGADVANILAFPDRFRTASGAPAPVLTLAVSRRCGPELLAASRAVAARLPMPGLAVQDLQAHRALAPAGPKAPAPEVRLFPNPAEEVAGIADLLRRAHLESGLAWSAMAVLVRSGTRSLPVLRRALVAAGVPCSVAADDLPVARDPAVAPLLIALRVAAGGLDSLAHDDARVLLASPLVRLVPSAARALGRRLRARDRASGVAVPRPAAVLLRDAVVDPRDLIGIEDELAAPLRRLHDLLAAAAAVVARGGTPEEALWTLWEGSGWNRRLARDAAGSGALARNANRDLDAVVALFEAAARLEEREPRAGVAALLDELGMQEVPAAPAEERGGTADAVRLLTAHRSKGLEWDLVVVASVQDETWPDTRARLSLLDADRIDRHELRPVPTTRSLLVDERRLFYVAVTRARRRLVLTAVRSSDETALTPSRLLDDVVAELPPTRLAGTDVLAPASLVARLRRTLTDPAAGDALRAAAAQRLAALAAARSDDGVALVPAASPRAWWGLRDWTPGARPVRDPDQPVRLSGSALAGYDSCSLRWFLEHEAQAASPASAAQGFGTVVHALAHLVAAGELPPDADALVERLDEVWTALAFDAPWHRDNERAEAHAALTRLLRWLATRPGGTVVSEVDYHVDVGDADLRGAVDRLEVDEEGRVHVVDFKTSRSVRSAADTQTDPQLGAYQLAAREGAFEHLTGADVELGGASLVFLRKETSDGRPVVRDQAPLPADGPTWADELVARTAKGIRDELFPARRSDGCDVCAFRVLCPAHDAGGQVVP